MPQNFELATNIFFPLHLFYPRKFRRNFVYKIWKTEMYIKMYLNKPSFFPNISLSIISRYKHLPACLFRTILFYFYLEVNESSTIHVIIIMLLHPICYPVSACLIQISSYFHTHLDQCSKNSFVTYTQKDISYWLNK